MADEVKFIGKDKLNRKLKILPDAFMAVAEKSLGEAADAIVKSMKAVVPVDQGELRDSIGWTFGEPPKGSATFYKTKAPKGLNLRLTIFAGNDEAFYARWREFGVLPFINGGIFKGTKNPGSAAQPFFYPAWRANKKKVKSRMTRSFNKEAKRIAAL